MTAGESSWFRSLPLTFKIARLFGQSVEAIFEHR
jgi:DNA-binding XRE family transcriptional regulator